MNLYFLRCVLFTALACVALITTNARADEPSESTNSSNKVSLLSIQPFYLPSSGVTDSERDLLNNARRIVNVLTKVNSVDEAIKETKGMPRTIWSDLDDEVTFDTILIEFDSSFFSERDHLNVFFISEKGGVEFELCPYDFLQELRFNNQVPSDDESQPTEKIYCVKKIRFFTMGSKEYFSVTFYSNSTRIVNLMHGDYLIEQTPPYKGRDYVKSNKDFIRKLVEDGDAKVPYYQKGHECSWNRLGEVIREQHLESPVLKSTRDDLLKALGD